MKVNKYSCVLFICPMDLRIVAALVDGLPFVLSFFKVVIQSCAYRAFGSHVTRWEVPVAFVALVATCSMLISC
jgi:hypothetical protein